MTDAPDRTWPNNAWLTYKVATSCWGRQVFPNTAQYILATPDAIAASPEGSTLLAEALLAQRAQLDADHAALIREAEARGTERAAGLVPPGYFNHDEEWAAWRAAQHLIRAEAAAIRGEKP